MNEGLNGWYGLAMILLVVTVLAVPAVFLGAAALRLMLKDELYFPEER